MQHTEIVDRDCIFCRIVAGDAPAFLVAEDEGSRAR
jgi:diadenosine tetraphosphate (Ap4A) HIT family hydrolase